MGMTVNASSSVYTVLLTDTILSVAKRRSQQHQANTDLMVFVIKELCIRRLFQNFNGNFYCDVLRS